MKPAVFTCFYLFYLIQSWQEGVAVRLRFAFYSLVHLHLTFSGVVCILSLQGRQEQCPFTTRLRGLKLACAILFDMLRHDTTR